MRASLALLLILTLTLPACDDARRPGPDELEVTCPDGVRVTSTVVVPGPGQTVPGDLVVTGSAEHSEGLTIRTLRVLDTSAENRGFNFDSWQATIPQATLLAQPGTVGPDGRIVTLSLTATEPCNEGEPVAVDIEGEQGKTVAVEPPVPFGALTVTLTYPGTHLDGTLVTYLPADGSEVSTLTISTTGIGGAKLLLDGPGVRFDDIADHVIRRVGADGSAFVELRSTQVGQHALTARAGEDSRGATLEVGGKPLLSATALTLAPGAFAYISGTIAGGVAAEVTCTADAAAAAAATITSSHGDLTDSGGVTFHTDDGQTIGFQIRIDAAATPGIFLITCVEQSYKQAGDPLVVTIE